MNSQYMVVYICKQFGQVVQSKFQDWSAEAPPLPVRCPSHLQDIKIYGRTVVMSGNVLNMLVDITKPKTCVSLDHLVHAGHDSKWTSLDSIVESMSLCGHFVLTIQYRHRSRYKYT